MRKTILLFLLFLSVTAVRTLGQNITFSHLTTDDGLSQFSVNSLYIDERGIIWIGTREGLNRYNGNDIKSFKLKKNDPNSSVQQYPYSVSQVIRTGRFTCFAPTV